MTVPAKHIIFYTSRGLAILMVIFLFYLVYFFYHPEQQVGAWRIINPIYESIKDLPIWLYLVVYFIAISFINVFVFIFLSFYFTYRRAFEDRKKRRFNRVLTKMITHYLFPFPEKDNDEERLVFYAWLHKNVRGMIALEALFTSITLIQETIAVDLSLRFKQMLDQSGIWNKVEWFLFSHDMSDRILAMKIISYLRIKEYNDVMLKYSKSKRHALRMEAILALIRLSEFNHLTTILDRNLNLSLLDDNIIINAVLKNQKMDIDYKSLLTADSIRKVAIGLYIVKHRRKAEYVETVERLLTHPDATIEMAAWDAFIALSRPRKLVSVIVSSFDNLEEDVKLMILRKCQTLINEEYACFLEKVIQNESLLLKIEAMKYLFVHRFRQFANYRNTQDDSIEKAFNEVADIHLY